MVWMTKLFWRRGAKEWHELLTRAYEDYFESGTISVNKWWKTRVAAERGLISCGVDAIPYAVELLDNRNPDIREDGAAVLAALGMHEQVVDALLRALDNETEDQPRDMLIIGLGRLRNTKAVPFLAATIRDRGTDGDTRFTAIQSLGQIARRRFDMRANPEAAALEWLDAHGY